MQGGAISSNWLRRLWERMGVMYGAAWENDNGDAPQDDDGALTLAGEVWREGLVGITGPQLARGLQRCILSHPEWPPRIGQFRALCLDVPTLTELRLELRADAAVRSPFARLVFEHLDPYQYRMTDARHAERLLAEAYAVAREHVLRGGALPEPAAGELEHAPPAKSQIPEHRDEREAHLRELLGGLAREGEGEAA